MKKQSGDVMKQRLLRAVNQLTHREKVILFAYINDKHEINNGGKLPKIIMGYLCEKFKINKDNVRQIKHRSWVKIQKYLSSSE